MNINLRNTIARFALAAYMAVGVLLEVGHHHPHDFQVGTAPILSSHNCGGKEIHIPLDKRHDCLACAQSAQRVSDEASRYVGNRAATSCFVGIPMLAEQGLETDVLHSGKRGPPAFFL